MDHKYDDGDIRRLRLFLAAADHGSMNRGAEALGIRRSSVRAAIDLLETRIGYPLLVRGRQGVTLTAAGERVAREARKMLKGADDHLGRIYQLPKENSAELRVGSIFGFHYAVVEDARKSVAGCRITPVPLDFLDPAAAIVNGLADAGVVLGPTQHDDVLQSYLISEEPRVAVTNEKHLQGANPRLVQLDELEHLEWPALPDVCDIVSLTPWVCGDIRGSMPAVSSKVEFTHHSFREWLLGGNRVVVTTGSVANAMTFDNTLIAQPLDAPAWPLNLVAPVDSPFPIADLARSLRNTTVTLAWRAPS